MALNNDGTKIYVHSYSDNRIYRFPLSTAYDLTTAGSSDQNLTYNSNTPAALGFKFSPDGTKLYLSQNSAPLSIEQYNLSTAFDLTTASYSATFNVTGQVSGGPYTVDFSSDGTKMYVPSHAVVYQYTLSTAWSVSTASYDSKSLNANSGGTYPLGTVFSIDWNDDGTGLFLAGLPSSGNSHIRKYTLTTAYDISTASYDSERDLGYTNIYSSIFADSGAKLFYMQNNGTVYRATTSAYSSITLPASVQNSSEKSSLTTQRVTYDFYTADGGTNVYLIGEELL